MKKVKLFYKEISFTKAAIVGFLILFPGNYMAGTIYAMGLHVDGIIAHILVTSLAFAHFVLLMIYNKDKD